MEELPREIHYWLQCHRHDGRAMAALRSALVKYTLSPGLDEAIEEKVAQLLASMDLCRLRAPHVAALLHMSERTMNRKLRQRHTSFRQILDRERRQRYLQMCGNESVNMDMLARHLGFSDGKSFSRVRRRWLR